MMRQLNTANALLNEDEEDCDARYVKALCLTRFDEYESSELILNQLLNDDTENSALLLLCPWKDSKTRRRLFESS